jgi:hypothetical protein
MGKVESGAVWVGQSLQWSGSGGTCDVRELEGITFEKVNAQDVLTGT